MPARIEKYDESSQERSRKRRRASFEPEKADNCNTATVKRQRLDAVSLQKCPRISRDEHFKAWLINAGRPLRSRDNMSHLPSPNPTTQFFPQVPTIKTQKSIASVRDSDYRKTLKKYNIYVPGEKTSFEFTKKVKSMVFRRRESSELYDAAIEQLKEISESLRNADEEQVRDELGAKIIPGYRTSLDQNLKVLKGPTLPLPKPKPDVTFAFSETAFDRHQLGVMNSLEIEPNGPSFASPSPDLRFPYLIIEFKSEANDGSIRVATNQVAGAGAIALNGLRETISRGLDLNSFGIDKIMVFSVAMDQHSACINVEWIGKIPNTNEYTYHLEELEMLSLRYKDSFQVLQSALKNIHDWASEDLLKVLVNALNEYRNKVEKETNGDPAGEPQTGAQSHASPSQLMPPPPKRARARVATSKARRETTERRKQPKENAQQQADTQRVGVRTRRAARLENSQ